MFRLLSAGTAAIRKPPYLYVFLVFVLFFCLASFISSGWLSADEHYQILEFANYKRGLLSKEFLAWEFQGKIRPALQPGIAFIFLNVMSFFDLKNPFTQTLLLRFLSAVLFILSSLCLYNSLNGGFKNMLFKYLYFLCTFSLYFFPVLGVRFFSENWSACFFMLAIASLFSYTEENGIAVFKIQNEFTSGILLSLSFLFRYQSAIMVASLFICLLLFHFNSLERWIRIFAGFMIVYLVGILIDNWFYGEWVLTSWNYFYVNLIEHKAASFGVSPWWWYFDQLVVGRWLTLLNTCILLLVILFGIRKWNHPFTWLFFPFLLVHMLIGHKELRFIFPILIFIPFMITDSLQFLDQTLKNRTLFLVMIAPLFIINGFGFVASCFRIHDNSSDIFRYIRTLPDKPIVIYFEGEAFYYTLANDAKTLSPRFYKDKHQIISRESKNDTAVSFFRQQNMGDSLVYIVVNPFEKVYSGMKLAYSPQPDWLSKLNYRNWMRAGPGNYWKLYKIENHSKGQITY